MKKQLCFQTKALLVYVFVLASCTNKSVNVITPDCDSTTVQIHVQDFNEAATLRYSEVYSDVRYVKLESGSGSTIGNIEKLRVTNSDDIVVFDRSNGKIVRYDSQGNFLNRIGEMGHSGNEYISPELMEYDEFNDQIIVYDGARKSLLHYGLDGIMTGVTPLHKYIDDFNIINDSTLAIFANYRDMLDEGEVAYNLEVIDNDGKVLYQYDPYTKEKENYRPASNNTLLRYDGSVMYHKHYTPMFYSLEYDAIRPAFYIDFASRQVPSEWLDYNNAGEVDRMIFGEGGNVAYCTTFYNTPNEYVLSAPTSSGTIMTIFIDKSDTTKQKFGAVMFNDIYGLMTSYPQYYNNGKLYGVINPETVGNFNSTLRDTNSLNSYKKHLKEHGYLISERDTSLINHLFPNANPTIQICTIK